MVTSRPLRSESPTAPTDDPSSRLPCAERPRTWAVWRQDDNGNRFVISAGHARVEAEQLCASFEARGHKQLYWAAPDEGSGDPG
jgi:hypothetical protein